MHELLNLTTTSHPPMTLAPATTKSNLQITQSEKNIDNLTCRYRQLSYILNFV